MNYIPFYMLYIYIYDIRMCILYFGLFLHTIVQNFVYIVKYIRLVCAAGRTESHQEEHSES